MQSRNLYVLLPLTFVSGVMSLSAAPSPSRAVTYPISLDVSSRKALVLEEEVHFDNIAEECEKYVGKPYVVGTEYDFSNIAYALVTSGVPSDAVYWISTVNIAPFNVQRCRFDTGHPSRAVCFKGVNALLNKLLHCRPSLDLGVDLGWTLNLDTPECEAKFRPVCENGLSCTEAVSQDACGRWLAGCPLRGKCEPDSACEDMTCRYPAPTSRMIRLQEDPGHFNVTCEIKEHCLKLALRQRPNDFTGTFPTYTLYKDGDFFSMLPALSNTTVSQLVSFAELDSVFRCMYLIDDVESEHTTITRPEITSNKHTVLGGESVELTCFDPGVVHFPDDSVSYMWSEASSEQPLWKTEENKLVLHDFKLNNAGAYRCSSVIDHVFSVWSPSVQLAFEWESPLLTATDTEIMQGHSVSLTCMTHRPEVIKYTFAKDGLPVQQSTEDPVFSIAAFTPEDAGVYQCALVNQYGEEIDWSNVVNLVLKLSLPDLDLTSHSRVKFRDGENVTFKCASQHAAGDDVEYVFFFRNSSGGENGILAVQNESHFSIENFSAENSGIYTCSVRPRSGRLLQSSQVESNSIRLRRTRALLESSATDVPEGTNLRLRCRIKNSPGRIIKYSWFRGEQRTPILTTVDNIVTLREFTKIHEGRYSCQAEFADPARFGPPLTSSLRKLMSVSRFQRCPCICPTMRLPTFSLAPRVVEEVVGSIKKNLGVAKEQLSSTVRRVSSAVDARPSSVSAGYVAIVLLSLVAGAIVLPDAVTLVMWVMEVWRARCNSKRPGGAVEG